MTDKLVPSSDALVQELRSLIEATRGRVAQTVNSELVAIYWQVGKRLREEVLGDERAAYGEQVVAEVVKALTAEFGRGFSRSNLYNMMNFGRGSNQGSSCTRVLGVIVAFNAVRVGPGLSPEHLSAGTLAGAVWNHAHCGACALSHASVWRGLRSGRVVWWTVPQAAGKSRRVGGGTDGMRRAGAGR